MFSADSPFYINCALQISDEDLKRVFDALDEDHTGKVHVNEFVAATMAFKYHNDEEHLRLAFNQMDQSMSGSITVEDLKKLLGRHVNEAKAVEMIRNAEDVVGVRHNSLNHRLTFEEFVEFVRKDGELEAAMTPAPRKSVANSVYE